MTFFEVGTAIGLAILMVGPSAITGTAPPQLNWVAQPVAKMVPLGQPIQIVVMGPPGGGFNVTVEGQPFNHTFPLFLGAYRIPNSTTNNSTGEPSYLVTVSTKQFPYGPYLVAVNNLSIPFTIGLFVFTVVLATNTSQTEQQLQYVWAYLNATDDRVVNLLIKQNYLESQEQLTFWLMFVGFLIVVFAIIVTRTRVAESNFAMRIRNFFHGLLWERANSDPFSPGRIPEESVPFDPKSIWVSDLYPGCAGCSSPWEESEKVAHLQEVHGIPRPRRDSEYYARPDLIKFAVRQRTDLEPTMLAVHRAMREVPSDLFADIEKRTR